VDGCASRCGDEVMGRIAAKEGGDAQVDEVATGEYVLRNTGVLGMPLAAWLARLTCAFLTVSRIFEQYHHGCHVKVVERDYSDFIML